MANPSKLDALLSRLANLSSAEPRTHAGVTFDPMNGIGGSPDAANADYRGYMAYMRPKQFLQINPPRDLEERPIDHILQAIDRGEPLGTPIVYVDRGSDGGWQVRGHEGRGRMHALQERHPEAYFPVAVQPEGEIRARHLKPEDVLNWIRPDMRGGHLPARPAVAILNSRPYVQPKDAEFFNAHGAHPALQRLIEELGR